METFFSISFIVIVGLEKKKKKKQERENKEGLEESMNEDEVQLFLSFV